jgi:preprotein translocase subunit YajC
MSSSFAVLFAQLTNAASAATSDSSAAPSSPPGWTMLLYVALIGSMIYFALLRPQMQAKKKQEETIKGSRTGDRIVTTSGIHGVITNVKENTVMVKVADNVKIEIEKTHIDKITRPDSGGSDSEKAATAKAS